MKRGLVLLGLLISGCVQLPPTAEDIQAKKFEAVPDKAVIYVVRPPVDSSYPGVLTVDTGAQVATMMGTYNRLEVPPGTRRLDGYIPPAASLTLQVEAGKIYFLRYTVRGGGDRGGATTATLQPMSDSDGRAMVAQGQLYP